MPVKTLKIGFATSALILGVSLPLQSFASASCESIFPNSSNLRNLAAALSNQKPDVASEFLKTLAGLKDEDAAYFIELDELKDIRTKGKSFSLATLLNEETMAKSKNGPVPIYNKYTMMKGGFVVLDGNIFAEGYFRQHLNDRATGQSTDPDFGPLIKKQPWFEWNETTGKYEYRETGAQEKILASLGPQVRLYRGAGKAEGEWIQSYQELQKSSGPASDASVAKRLEAISRGSGFSSEFRSALRTVADRLQSPGINSSERKALSKQLEDAYIAYLGSNHKPSVFLTPKREGAMKWTSGSLIELGGPQKSLQKLSQSGQMYVGIEYDYIEAALVSPNAIVEYLRKAKVQIVEPAPQAQTPGIQIVSPEDP